MNLTTLALTNSGRSLTFQKHGLKSPQMQDFFFKPGTFAQQYFRHSLTAWQTLLETVSLVALVQEVFLAAH